MVDIMSLVYPCIDIIPLKRLYNKIRVRYINHYAQNITNSNKKVKIKHCKKDYNFCDYSFKYSYSNEQRIKTINVILPVKINKASFKILQSSRHQIRPQTKHDAIHNIISNAEHLIKPVFDIPAPLLRLTQRPVFNNAQDDQKEITSSWNAVCCILPDTIKTVFKPLIENKSIITITNTFQKSNIPGKLKKARNYNRTAKFLKLTRDDITDLKRLLGQDIFRKIPRMSISWLKTAAIKKNIDDWISQIDSKASYEDNLKHLHKNFTAVHSDNELMAKYEKYDDMLNDSIYGMMPDAGELRL